MEGKSWLDKLRRHFGSGAEENALPAATPLRDLRIVVLDCETTGLDKRRDAILSVGALSVTGNVISTEDHFEGYVDTTPWQGKGGASIIVHGILPRSKRYHYLSEPELLTNLSDYIGDSWIVGHHIGFDMDMIGRALEKHDLPPLKNRVVDTVRLAQRLRPSGYWSPPDDYTLDTLARRYRIPLSDRHTALGDCYITAVLWLKLCARLAERIGRDLTVSDL